MASPRRRRHRLLLLLLHAAVAAAVAATALVGLAECAAASPAAVVSVSSPLASASLCPRCPLCSRPTTPLKQRLQLCHATSSYVLSFLSWGTSALAASQHGGGASYREQRQRYPLELPFATDDAVRRQCMRDLQDVLLARVRGQPQVVAPLLDVLRRKLAYPREPVVVHLAGDNGVGKTHTARLISKALSLRCAVDRDVCDAGDSLLTVAGTGFDGLSVAEARRRIVAQVMAHVDRYPHGVVLIDDLTAMDPALVSALAPLFGRAAHFPEQLPQTHGAPVPAAARAAVPTTQDGIGDGEPRDREAAAAAADEVVDAGAPWLETATTTTTPPPPLSQLLVVVTTDFGRQGRTVGKSRAEIQTMIQHDFADLYGALLPAHTRTFIYHPFTTAMAEDVVRSAVLDLPCALGEHLLAFSTISDEAVSFLVHRHRPLWFGKENGHALRRLIEDELVTQIVVYWETQQQQQLGERLRAYFDLDEATARVLLRTPGRPDVAAVHGGSSRGGGGVDEVNDAEAPARDL
ncbi:hypothetical protein NESM_000651900 [Novymonas esmeraldas]|uniref:AAA+ ATPase domain-containing protein n=1 Tax=Novymonas esmeraldas TaxID=1808958 RepID=A0AAW0EU62_9TRYP